MTEYSLRPAREMVPKARAAAAKALELDPSSAEAHAVLGMTKRQVWDWKGAESEFRKAIALNPNYSTAHHWYSSMLRALGLLDEAMTEIRRAQELDPLSLIIQVNIVQCFMYGGQYERALQEIQKGLELNPDFAVLNYQRGFVHLYKGLLPQALSDFEKTRALTSDTRYALPMVGHVLGRLGRQAEAMEMAARLEDFGRQGYAVQYGLAHIYFGLGEKDKMFQCLEEAQRQGQDLVCMINTEPLWKELRADPRVQQLLRKMNLQP